MLACEQGARAMQNQQQEQRLEELRASRRWRPSDARYVLEVMAASGEPLARFARHMKIGHERLRWWSKRLAIARDFEDPTKAGFESTGMIPVVVKAEPSRRAPETAAAVLIIEGARVELSELTPATASWSATLLESLRRRR